MQQAMLQNSRPGWSRRYVGCESSKAGGKGDLPSVNGFHLCPGISNFVTFTNGFAGVRHTGLDL